MKMKNKDIIDVMTSLEAIRQEKLPIKFSWKIETTRRTLKPFHEAVTEAIDKIKTNKAIKDEKGKILVPLDDKGDPVPGTLLFDRKEIQEINDEIDALLNEEVEVLNVEIRLSDFPDALEMSPESISKLEKVIET
jgi:hypothetical protein